MQTFTPVMSLIGGSLIGVSAVIFLWFNGRIAGISGIFHGMFAMDKANYMWRICFLFGMVVGSLIYYILPAIHFVPRTHYPVSLLIFSGLLVGVGTRISGGCTSGHGVCGLARLSKRSLVATVVFFIMGMLSTYFIRHIGGIR